MQLFLKTSNVQLDQFTFYLLLYLFYDHPSQLRIVCVQSISVFIRRNILRQNRRRCYHELSTVKRYKIKGQKCYLYENLYHSTLHMKTNRLLSSNGEKVNLVLECKEWPYEGRLTILNKQKSSLYNWQID